LRCYEGEREGYDGATTTLVLRRPGALPGLFVQLLHRERNPVGLGLRSVDARPGDPEAVLTGLVVDAGVLVRRAAPVPVDHGVGLRRRADGTVLLRRVVAPVVVTGRAVLGFRVVRAGRRAADTADTDQYTRLVEVADRVGQIHVDVLGRLLLACLDRRRGLLSACSTRLSLIPDAVPLVATAGASCEQDGDQRPDEHPTATVLAVWTHVRSFQ